MTDSPTTPVRLLVVDDHPMYREGLRASLDGRDGIEVVAGVGSAEEALDAAAAVAPEVVIMDVNLPGMNGVEATRALLERQPGIAVLVLSMLENAQSVAEALTAGARGYLVKGAARDEIVRAVHAVAGGQTILDGDLGAQVLAALATGDRPTGRPFPQLTTREHEVLDLLAAGLANAAIAQRLHVSDKTVRNLVSSVFAKIHARDRSDAIVKARSAGLGGT